MRLGTITIGLCVVLGLARFVGAVEATTGSLDGTKHDMRSRLGITQVCQPCHVPHNAPKGDKGPIWNHALSTLSFQRTNWEGVTETLTLGAASKLCMGCHDGVTAVGSYGSIIGSDPITGGAALGNDFSKSHPVGVEYPTSGPYEPIGDVQSYLHDNKVECSSCHRAHGNKTNSGFFLRVTMDGSQLCRQCHTF